MTSHLLYKTRCPRCAENGKDRHGDNLGVYSDGHSHCFSCGYTSLGTATDRIKNSGTKPRKPIPDLPEDISNTLGEVATKWLLQYFTPEHFPRCLYSSSEQKLYFMLPDGAFQYRYFGDNKDHPKWVGYGINENLIHITSPPIPSAIRAASIVLVEDIISGLKVGHISPTLTLFGSNISLKRLATLKLLGYNEVVIWLDWDKKEYAVEAARKAQSIGLQARVIHTKLDPKDYSTEEIQQWLQD